MQKLRFYSTLNGIDYCTNVGGRVLDAVWMSNSDKVPTTSTGLFTQYHPAQSTSSNTLNSSKARENTQTDASVLFYLRKRYIFHVSEVLKRLHLAALHSLIKTLSKCDIICGKILQQPSETKLVKNTKSNAKTAYVWPEVLLCSCLPLWAQISIVRECQEGNAELLHEIQGNKFWSCVLAQ